MDVRQWEINKRQDFQGCVSLFGINGLRSQFPNQIADTDSKSFGKAYKRRDAGCFFATFQFPEINRMQIGFFSQFLLAQLRLLAKAANRLTNNFLIGQLFRHDLSGKQEPSKHNTVYSPLFRACIGESIGIKTTCLFYTQKLHE